MDVIRERVSVAEAKERSYIEWQTRALASFIASTSMSEKGAKQLMQAAEKLSMLPPEESEQKPEPRKGSFERLGGLFGAGGHRPR